RWLTFTVSVGHWHMCPLSASLRYRAESGRSCMSNRDVSDAIVKAWANADLDGVMAMYADDRVVVDPSGEYRGAVAIRAFTEDAFATFTPISVDTSNFLTDGDLYVAEWTTRMTNTGPLKLPGGSAIPATGQTVEFSARVIGRVD